MVRAPSGIANIHLRRRAYLLHDACGLTLKRRQYSRVARHPFIVVLHPKHHVLALPQVAAVRLRHAVASGGLALHRHAAYGTVRALPCENVPYCGIKHLLEPGVSGMAVLHRARPYELAPHLAQRELRALPVEEDGELVVRHVSLVPVLNASGDRLGEPVRKPHSAWRERLKHVCWTAQDGATDGDERRWQHFPHQIKGVFSHVHVLLIVCRQSLPCIIPHQNEQTLRGPAQSRSRGVLRREPGKSATKRGRARPPMRSAQYASIALAFASGTPKRSTSPATGSHWKT